jgi:glycerol kinase
MYNSPWPVVQAGAQLNPNTPLYLAIDQGGHASRASLVTADGAVIGSARVPVQTRHKAAEQVEHDPEDMVASVRAAINEAVACTGPAPIMAAGLATQRSSVVCWELDSGAALSPVLSWQDRRTAGWLEQLAEHAAEIRQRTGLPLSPHYGASKLRWCLDHLPAVKEAWKDRRLAWGPLASFLTYRLTQEKTLAADPANASRTLLWSLDDGDWDPRLAELFGVPTGALPPCADTRQAWGHIAVEQRRIPLAVVTGDQSAALFAAGQRESRVMINLGTGAFLQQGLPHRPPPSRLLAGLAFQAATRRVYALEGTVNGAGSALSWVAGELDLEQGELFRRLPGWLNSCKRPPLFLNGIAGLGTPYMRPIFASRFIGEGSSVEKCVAVCESIVFLLQINLEEMAAGGCPAREIIISGGLSELDGLCQRLADLSGLPVYRPQNHEATVQGLIHLLAHGARPMTDADMGTGFLPRNHHDLHSRYRAWHGVLDAALLK